MSPGSRCPSPERNERFLNPGPRIRDYMGMYGKQTETAIAAVSFLAEIWQGPRTRRVSAADIADARGLQRPFVAKLLSALSQVGIVSGSPGPGGGYALAKDPSEIRLRDVWLVFERPESHQILPFAARICLDSEILKRRINDVETSINALLDETTFDDMVSEHVESAMDLTRNRRMADTVETIPDTNGRARTLNGHGTNGHHSS